MARNRNAILPQSTIRAMPFLQYLGRQMITTAAGLNTISLTVGTLASDLVSNRLVKLSSFTVKFFPSGIAASNYASAQLVVFDQATALAVPITQVKPLSLTNPTILTGSFPSFQGWVNAGSSNIGLQIIIYTNAISTLYYDVQSRIMISQDTLT